MKKSLLILPLIAGGGCTSVPLESTDSQIETGLYLREAVKVRLYTLSPGHYAPIGSRGSNYYFESSPKTKLSSGLARGFVTKAILADPHRAVMVKPGKLCVVTVFNVYVCKDVEFGTDKLAELKPFPNEED